ncbi:MAG TPA: small, acid-soluble spore protein, alpha/beta type [Clostridiaceae bacterium]|nr:small, acid-soluble spore protein, alpha/beta type [Clostridiaceae bacterium]
MEKKENKLKMEDKLKYEVARELGLLEKVMKYGWKSLTAKETGRIGGLVTKRKKAIQLQRDQQA